MKTTIRHGASLLLLAIPAWLTVHASDSADDTAVRTAAVAEHEATPRSFPVSGSAIHYFSEAIIHSQETSNGLIQRSTDIIQLTGDLSGYVLYHPTSVIDFTTNTLVNTGTQIFSGTVAGSAPVILHDSRFRFVLDLATGATTGEVYLGRSNDAPHHGGWYECQLTVVGTGVTPQGDNLSDYTGTCTARGNVK